MLYVLFLQDGALNDEELNKFQFQCFGQPLTGDELASVRQMVAERMADGLNEAGTSIFEIDFKLIVKIWSLGRV